MPNLKLFLILATLLILSGVGNLWQFRQNAKAGAECEAKIATLESAALSAVINTDTSAISISREITERAEQSDAIISNNTNEAAERVRIITREIPVPADCPVALPDGVQDALSEAAAAANRRL